MTDTSLATPVGTIELRTPASLDRVVILAHGAGAGIDHPWMREMDSALGVRGFDVVAFNYLYTSEGRKAPDRLPKLLQVHAALLDWVTDQTGTPPVLAGKSMGGRVGGHLAADVGDRIGGVVYLGYPLVAMGKTEPRDTSHLDEITVPQLFISGSRDRMGPLDLLSTIADRVPDGRLIPIESGDHSLKPLKATGRTQSDTISEAADHIADAFLGS